MKAIFDVYGSSLGELSEEARELAEILGVTWQERQSDYRGRYYQGILPASDEATIVLQSNDLSDESGSYLQLSDFPEHRLLLFINKHEHPDMVRQSMIARPQWEFLRRRELD